MNKRESFILRKQTNNLPKYNLGKMQASGYLRTTNSPDLSSFSATNQYDMTNDVNTLKNSILPSAVSKVGTYGMLGTKILDGFTSASSAAATNLSNYTAKLGTSALADAAKNGTLAKTVEDGLKGTGQSVAKSGLSTIGQAASVAGALYGGYNVANDIIGYSDRITASDMLNMTSKVTQSKNGVNYTAFGGFDAEGIRNYTDAQNKSSSLNLTMDAAGTGASIGALVGSYIPVIGTIAGGAIGGVLGGLGGFVGSLFGGDSRKEKVEKDIKDILDVQNGYNTQAQSEAGSEGLRNDFYSTHADKGKNKFDNGKVGDIRMVHTSHGIVPGVQFGLAGKGESIYNPLDGTASVYDEGKFRVDNIPTGVPLPGYTNGKNINENWRNAIIFGNKTNPETGNTFAEDAKPYSRILEQYNKGKNNMTLGKHTELVNRKNAMSSLNHLADVQMYTANCGKNRFDDGKPKSWVDAYATPTSLMGMGNGLVFNIADTLAANKETPYYPNTYVPYLGAMPIRHTVDYAQLFANLYNTNRESIYNINQAGSLSAGQKEALKISLNLRNAAALNGIHTAQVEKQAEYDKQYEDALRQIGLTDQQHANQSAATLAEGYARAVGAKLKLQATSRKNWYNTTQQAIKDMDTYYRYKQMLNLYDRQLSNDYLKITKEK